MWGCIKAKKGEEGGEGVYKAEEEEGEEGVFFICEKDLCWKGGEVWEGGRVEKDLCRKGGEVWEGGKRLRTCFLDVGNL